METPSPPVYAAVTLSRTNGARLEVRSATGLNGDRIFNALRPFLANGVRWNAPAWTLSGPWAWLFPRLELTVAGRPHWRALGAASITTIGLLGALSGVVAGARAGFEAVFVAKQSASRSTVTQPTTSTGPLPTSSRHFPGQAEVAVEIVDLTRGRRFGSKLDARPCDVLLYRIRVYNPGPSDLHHVWVAGSINTLTPYRKIIPTLTIYTPDGIQPDVSIQPVINLPQARTQTYIAHSTEILNSAGAVVRTSAHEQLSDAITATGNGIPIGDVDLASRSTSTFVRS